MATDADNDHNNEVKIIEPNYATNTEVTDSTEVTKFTDSTEVTKVTAMILLMITVLMKMKRIIVLVTPLLYLHSQSRIMKISGLTAAPKRNTNCRIRIRINNFNSKYCQKSQFDHL